MPPLDLDDQDLVDRDRKESSEAAQRRIEQAYQSVFGREEEAVRIVLVDLIGRAGVFAHNIPAQMGGGIDPLMLARNEGARSLAISVLSLAGRLSDAPAMAGILPPMARQAERNTRYGDDDED